MKESEALANSSEEEASVVAERGAGILSPANAKDNNGGISSEEESWLEDSDDVADGVSALDREWKTRREPIYHAGYREGISAGKADAAQDGFNHGYKDSVMVGYKWGIVRGVTSALAHLPNELKMRLVEKDEVRKELLNLHEAVDSISTEDALKLFSEDIQRAKSVERRSDVASGLSATNENSCALEKYLEKLELILQQSPVVDLHSEAAQSRAP